MEADSYYTRPYVAILELWRSVLNYRDILFLGASTVLLTTVASKAPSYTAWMTEARQQHASTCAEYRDCKNILTHACNIGAACDMLWGVAL